MVVVEAAPLVCDVNNRRAKTAFIPTPLLKGLGLEYQLRLVSGAGQDPGLELKERALSEAPRHRMEASVQRGGRILEQSLR